MLAAKENAVVSVKAKIQEVPNKKERHPYIANRMHMFWDLRHVQVVVAQATASPVVLSM
jgi:hypothetical protein